MDFVVDFDKELADNIIALTDAYIIHNPKVDALEQVAKAGAALPGHLGVISGKVGEVIDDVQELVGDVRDIAVEVIEMVTGGDDTPSA